MRTLVSTDIREPFQRLFCRLLVAWFLLVTMAESSMGPLVSAEVGELRVGPLADIASERLEAAVYVGVLFEAAEGGEGLPALRADVVPAAQVLGSNVALEVAGVGEYPVARGALMGRLYGIVVFVEVYFLFIWRIGMDYFSKI